jgi:hypothetical protein
MDVRSAAVGSLFLRTQDGRLVERWWDANSRKKSWLWINHGHPPDARIVSAPGSLINGLSIFMTGTSGNLFERFWNSKEWVSQSASQLVRTPTDHRLRCSAACCLPATQSSAPACVSDVTGRIG